MNLSEFVLARVAEDEAVAIAAASQGILTADGEPKFHYPEGHWEVAERPYEGAWFGFPGSTAKDEDAFQLPEHRHATRHDPARVLAECAAKRRIVERHTESSDDGYYAEPTCLHCEEPFPCRDLRDLAAVYADHPDYREEWRP